MANENKKFYNENIKLRYLSEKEKTLSIGTFYIETQFKKVYKMECELDKDVSNWTFYEVMEYYKLLNSTSLDSLININNIFSQYTQFCLQNNLVKDNQNHFLEFKRDILKECLNKTKIARGILTRKEIEDIVYEIVNPKDKFIVLSLFEFGKSPNFRDIVNAKPEDVHGNTLKLGNRTVKISDKLIDVIDDCMVTDVYYAITGKGLRQMPLRNYGYIVKSYPNIQIDSDEYQRGRNIYIIIKRVLDCMDLGWMTPNKISESGKIHMIKTRAAELGITPIQYVRSKYIQEVEEQYGCSITVSVFLRKYSEYLGD